MKTCTIQLTIHWCTSLNIPNILQNDNLVTSSCSRIGAEEGVRHKTNCQAERRMPIVLQNYILVNVVIRQGADPGGGGGGEGGGGGSAPVF